MSTIRIQTTQNVSVEYTVASVGERIVATLIDDVVLLVWAGFWLGMVGALGVKQKAVWIGMGVLVGATYVFYHLLCEVFFNGQSLGKRARDLKVIRLDGTSPSLGDYLLRWVLRIVDSGFVALIAILLNGRGQRLGDMAAGTTVVSLNAPRAAAPLPTTPDAGYVAVFPQAAHLADHDVAIIRQVLRKGLERENYVLLNELANKVKALLGVQADLPDEAFLRTVLRDHSQLLNGAPA
jgi:uncharacterized RDD family membrane protein YckC